MPLLPEDRPWSESEVKNYVSQMQGGPALPTTPWQDPEVLNRQWAAAQDGGPNSGNFAPRPADTQFARGGTMGINPQVVRGEANQRANWEQQNRELRANNYLPPGITREGLINQARARANQVDNMTNSQYNAQPLPPGNLENSKAGGATTVVNTGSGERVHQGAGAQPAVQAVSPEEANTAAAYGMTVPEYRSWLANFQRQNGYDQMAAQGGGQSEWTPGGWYNGGNN